MEKHLQTTLENISREVKIYNASKSDKIKNFTNEKLRALLIYLYGLIGLKGEKLPDNIETMILINFIKEKLNHFSAEEFKIAFEMGINKELNIDMTHYQHFTTIYLSEVMNVYNLYKFDIIKKVKQKQEGKKMQTITDEQKFKIMHDATIQYWKLYKNGHLKDFSDIGAAKYNFLDSLGVIPFTVERKKKMYEQAEIIYNNELKEELTSSNSIRKSEIKKILDDWQKNICEHSHKERIKLIAKKIALKTFFDELIELNEDLELLVKEKNYKVSDF